MRSKRITSVWFSLLLGGAMSCTTNSLEVPINASVNRIEVHPFHIDFFDTTQSIDSLRSAYAPFLTPEVPNEIWEERRRDDYFVQLHRDAMEVFPSTEVLNGQLTQLIAHYRYYLPTAELPEIYTYVGGADLEYPIIDADSLIFIALDVFLGEDHPAYAEVPQYIRRRFTPAHLDVKLAQQLAERHIHWNPTDLTLINSMIYWGKIWCFMEAMLPQKSMQLLHEYTADEELWAETYETEIWSYLLAQDLLFDQRTDTRNRFVEEAPFSKFYAGIDRESPGRIGRWLGWRIVRSYMQEQSASLPELMKNTDHRTIFNQSKYKPHG